MPSQLTPSTNKFNCWRSTTTIAKSYETVRVMAGHEAHAINGYRHQGVKNNSVEMLWIASKFMITQEQRDPSYHKYQYFLHRTTFSIETSSYQDSLNYQVPWSALQLIKNPQNGSSLNRSQSDPLQNISAILYRSTITNQSSRPRTKPSAKTMAGTRGANFEATDYNQ